MAIDRPIVTQLVWEGELVFEPNHVHLIESLSLEIPLERLRWFAIPSENFVSGLSQNDRLAMETKIARASR